MSTETNTVEQITVPSWWNTLYTETFLVPVARLERNIELSPAKLPEETIRGLFRYGAKQKLNDAHAPATAAKFPVESEREADAVKRVDKCYEALLAGTAFRGDRTIDPLAAKLRVLARAIESASPATQAAIAALLAGKTVAEIVPPAVVEETKRRNRDTK
jgi:hypothetical protein